jgi:hypothetical protein
MLRNPGIALAALLLLAHIATPAGAGAPRVIIAEDFGSVL